MDSKTRFQKMKQSLKHWNYWGEWNKQYELNEDIFQTIDSPEKAYWLGFIVADGGIDQSQSGKLEIGLHIKDKKHLEKFQRFLQSNLPIAEYPNRKSPRALIRVCRKKFVRSLVQYGIVPNKSKSIQFPNISKTWYSDFIRGVFDGDGYMATTEFRIYSGTKNFLQQIQKVLMDACNINKTKILHTGNKHYCTYSIKYGGRNVVKSIVDFLLQHPGPLLERKYGDWI